nr:MAG TPA: hypothetical protein [Caudoviricetes sp.]
MGRITRLTPTPQLRGFLYIMYTQNRTCNDKTLK